MKGIVVDEDSLSREVIYDGLCNITKADMLATDFECLPNDFWQATSVMVKKEPHKFCGIFDDRITVTVDGDIVGCQMLIGNDNNIVGNIHDADAVEKIRSRVRNYKDNAACSECWCRHLCGGCAVLRFYSKDKGEMTADPNRELCSFTKMYLEEILYKLYQIRSDKALWPLFLKKAASKLKHL